METIDAITSRWSCRAYLDKPVSRELVTQVLAAARWAPSGTNTQPWQVAVVGGQIKEQISAALLQAREAGLPEAPDYTYYPTEWREPYKGRRRTTGLALYKALDIGKDDPEARLKSWNNNYRFFGAPLGLLFFIDADLNKGSWVDLGMFMQNVMLAATGLGLATCPQFSLAEYPDRVRSILGMDDDKLLVAGMSLGYADTAHPVNQYRLEREDVDNFTRWYD